MCIQTQQERQREEDSDGVKKKKMMKASLMPPNLCSFTSVFPIPPSRGTKRHTAQDMEMTAKAKAQRRAVVQQGPYIRGPYPEWAPWAISRSAD
ncbi:unnamed protein product [Lota lota]